MDLAEIGLRADSSELKAADLALQKFGRTARTTETATDRFRVAEEKASRATDRLRRDVDMASKSFSFMRGALVGVATSLAAAFGAGYIIKEFIQNTSEAEHVQAQLAAALASTNAVSGQTIDSLNAHAEALMKVSTFGDEAIGTAQSILLTFTKIGGETFPRATAAVLDLATRMGGDLQGASLQLGKALNDPIRGLSMLGRAGIQFTEAQRALIKEMVETNRLAEAQGVILEEVERQFGGSALAARETLGGALKALSEAFGNLFEVSGPGAETLRLAIENLIVAISDPAFMAFVNMVGVTLFTAINLLVQAFSLLATVIPPIIDFLIQMAPLLIAVFGPVVLQMVLGLAAAVGTTLLGAFAALWAVILANPLTIIVAAIVTILSYFVDWEIAIRNLIQAWALFMYEWHSFWGNTQSQQYWIKVGLDAGNTIKELKAAAVEAKNILADGVDFGAEEAAPKLEDAMTAGGNNAARAISAAMTDDKATAIYESLNGKVIKPLGDTLMAGGKFIHNEVTGAITKGTDMMKEGIEGAGTSAGETMSSAITQGGRDAGAQIFNSIESAFATLAPVMEVLRAFERAQRAELSLIRAEAEKARAEAYKARQEGDALNAGGRPGGRGGSAGSSSGGGGSSSSEPGINWMGSFARGGSFVIGGSGGTDSVPIGMNVTPGERVTITPPQAQQKTELKITNVLDPRAAISSLGTAEGERAVMNVIQARIDELKALMGVN